MTTVEDPVETADPHGHGSRIDHPAFAQIAASRVRCAGGEILYGSDFPHQNFVSIRICRSSLNRDLSNDWHYGKDQMMEVNMSEAQWATFVSSMNVGSGTPCTLASVDGKPVPGLTLQNKTEKFKKEAAEDLAGAMEQLDALLKELDEMGLPKGKTAALKARAAKAKQELESNLPYVAKQFGEHVESTVEKAKAEINAYMVTTLQRAGLEGIANGTAPLLIEDQDQSA